MRCVGEAVGGGSHILLMRNHLFWFVPARTLLIRVQPLSDAEGKEEAKGQREGDGGPVGQVPSGLVCPLSSVSRFVPPFFLVSAMICFAGIIEPTE